MSALVTCVPCSFGNCDECQVSHLIEGVLGGWVCDCPHGDEAKRRARRKREATIPFDGEGEFGHWEDVPEKPDRVGFGTPVRMPGRRQRWVPKQVNP